MAAKVNIQLSVRDFKKLADFLACHEYQIAINENDYGDLAALFYEVYEHEASEDC